MVGLIALISALVLTALAVVLFQTSQSKLMSEEERTSAADAERLFDAREAFEVATLDLVVIRMLDGVGVEGDRSSRLESSAADAQDAFAAIE